MVHVANLRVRSFSLDYLDLYWSLADGTSEDPRNYEFVVQWAPNQLGPFADLSAPIIDGYRFRDTTVKGQHSFFHQRYYRLIIRNRSSDAVEYFPEQGGVRLGALPDLAALEMARQENLRIKEFSGRQVYVFSKRTFGPRCVACFDPVQQRRVRGNCQVCFGTGTQGGYHAPAACHMQIHTPPEVTLKTQDGSVQQSNTRFKMGNYPELFEGDLVVEAENVRWVVSDQISKIKKARALIRQEGTLHAVPRTDAGFQVPINLTVDQVGDLLPGPERNYTAPSNLANVDIDAAILRTFGPRNHERK